MSDSWATAFNLSYLNAGSSMDSAARLVALAGQRQAERRLQAVAEDHEHLFQQNAALCHDLERFIAYGRNVAAENLALREYIDRLSQEVAGLRQNESIFLQEGVDLRDYIARLREENTALRQYGHRVCEENVALKLEVEGLLEEET